MKFPTSCFLAIGTITFLGITVIRADDTTTVARAESRDTTMVLAMHYAGPPATTDVGMAAASTPISAPAAAAHTTVRRFGIKPAKVGEVLSIMLPAAVLVGIFLIPAL